MIEILSVMFICFSQFTTEKKDTFTKSLIANCSTVK